MSGQPRKTKPQGGGRSQRRRQGGAQKRRRRAPVSPARRRWAMAALGGLILLVFGVGGGVAWVVTPAGGDPSAAIEVTWPEAASASEGANLLGAAGVVQSPRLFALLVSLAGIGGGAQPGEHLFHGDLSPLDVLRRLKRASARTRVKVVLPEGYNRFQVAARLEQRSICSRAAFARASASGRLLAELGLDAGTAEGYLFPATYELRVDTPASEVLRLFVGQALRRYQSVAELHPQATERLERELDFGMHEVLTLASMVEKEAQHADERVLIASVFFNRLRDQSFQPRRMLQSDPTAAYGCLLRPGLGACPAAPGGRVTPAMLRDATNPYNTYRNPGLPPGPIANPGEAAIEAVLSPADTDFLFFVASGGGRHRFSRTFAEHRAAISSQRGP